jgi:hypothetical protein
MARLTQSRAADTLALGIFDRPTLSDRFPRPGAPEVMLSGLGCAGSCGCGGRCGGLGAYPGQQVVGALAMPGSKVLNAIGVASFSQEAAAAVTAGMAYLAYRLIRKRR